MKGGTRSNLWVAMREAIAQLRPSWVVWENVRGAYSAEADSDVEPCPGCVGDGPSVHLRALGRVLGDLATIGYDAAWHGLTAASVGAPHGRYRVFLLAWPQSGDADMRNSEGRQAAGFARKAGSQAGSTADADNNGLAQFGRKYASECDPDRRCGADGSGDKTESASRMMGYLKHADAAEGRPDQDLRDVRGTVHAQAVQRQARGSDAVPGASELLTVVREYEDRSDEGRPSLACAEASAVELPEMRHHERPARPPLGSEPKQQRPDKPSNPLLFLPSQDALVRGPAEAYGRCGEGHGYGCSAWGVYAQAIHRWEVCLGRVAPAPTERAPKGGRRLSAYAVEFMMGLPEGHVTEVPGLTRNEQLKALGNGVVPQQAEAALEILFNAVAVAA